ncbi:MAG: nucleotidyl transferase AbiEii/AbiGii toxin family protein [Acidimicrobiaceae bacterium]|nr:nucleotidyl transferase AbiEii/AbiGii toxin family protein [Acidimicrobiaceae bacterium]
MDELQDRLVRIGLATLTEHGFALAGGYALQAHGLVDRFSEDVDLFTNRWDTAAFARAVDAVVDAYRREGLDRLPPRPPNSLHAGKEVSRQSSGR